MGALPTAFKRISILLTAAEAVTVAEAGSSESSVGFSFGSWDGFFFESSDFCSFGPIF